MQFKELWEKVKKYDYKKLLCARNYVIAGCVALLVVAVILNATLGGSGGDEDVLGNESTKILGNSVLTDANADGDDGDAGTETAGDFFASACATKRWRCCGRWPTAPTRCRRPRIRRSSPSRIWSRR